MMLFFSVPEKCTCFTSLLDNGKWMFKYVVGEADSHTRVCVCDSNVPTL